MASSTRRNTEALPGVFREQGNKAIYFKGTGEQMPFSQGNRGTSSEIWETGEHKLLCANDIKYCYKESLVRRDTEWDGISDSACLVCFGVFQRTQFRRYLDFSKRNRNTGTKH